VAALAAWAGLDPDHERNMEPVTQPNTPLHQTPVPNAGAGDLTGRTLGDYHILRQLGQGGMGQVFLAEQVSLKRKVALKLLRPETANNPTALARFQKEAEAVARFTHANIVQVYQIGQVEGLVFMALEYVEGRNLREYLARKGPPDALLALSIMRQVAGALQRAGELGLVHRDIKPENILLTRKGEVKVADFGLVRCLSEDSPGLNLTQSGVTMGTPLYMSPEQVEGKLLDCRSDIYSFGVTCYHMLAGQPPFTGENAFEVAFKHVRHEAVPLEQLRPDLPEGLCALVGKMMAKDPGQRHQTGRELLRDIIKVREGLSGLTAAVPTYGANVELVPASELRGLSDDTLTVPAAAPEPRRRSRLAVLIASSLLIAILLGIGVAWSQRERNALPPPHPTPDAVVVEAVTNEKRREESLDNLVKDIRSGSHVEFKSSTYDNCLDLGLLYLKQKRWDEASTLFTQLDTQKNERYHWLGHLGLAIVLARKDQPKESITKFKEIIGVLGPIQARPLVPPRENAKEAISSAWWQNGELKTAIFEALEHNKKNNAEDSSIRVFFVTHFARKG
jgi:serine/threonine protein kinase